MASIYDRRRVSMQDLGTAPSVPKSFPAPRVAGLVYDLLLSAVVAFTCCCAVALQCGENLVEERASFV